MALNGDDLRRIGFNDPNVINGILNDPGQVARYERELGLGGSSNVSSSNVSSSGFQPPLTAPDLQALQGKVYEQLKPYYLQLVKEAEGDFGRAKSILEEDYKRGVRVATENFELGTGRAKQDIQNALGTLGIEFGAAQETKIDELNKRGMAVAETTPGGPLATLGVSEMLPTTDSAMIANPADARVGRGSVELGRLQGAQRLRQEAVQRAHNRTLEDLGITLKRETAPSADKTKAGRLELEKSRGLDTETRRRQLTGQNIYNQLQSDVYGKALQLGQTGIKANEANLANVGLQNEKELFYKEGI